MFLCSLYHFLDIFDTMLTRKIDAPFNCDSIEVNPLPILSLLECTNMKNHRLAGAVGS